MKVCKVTKVFSFEKGVRPIVGDFEQGPLPQEISLQHPCSIRVNSKTGQQVVVVKRKETYLTGRSDTCEMCQAFLLVRNKRSKEGRLIPICSCLLSKVSLEDDGELNEPLPKRSKTERRSDLLKLTKNFGSKRSQRQSDIGLRMEMNTMGNTAEIAEVIQDLEVDEHDLKDSTEDVDEVLKVLPPSNRGASSVDGVYQLENFLSTNELKSLELKARSLEKGSLESDEKENIFFTQLLKETKGNLKKIQILLYVNCIMKFLRCSIREIKTKNFPSTICSYSLLISKRIIREFTIDSKSGRLRPMYLKDKAVSYIVALLLLISNFTVDVDALSAALKGVSQKKLKLLMKTVGLVPSLGSKHVLKIPLPPLPTAPSSSC